MEIVSSAMPLDKIEQLKQKIANLRISLEQSLPNYESLLFLIHRELKDDPEINHLLSEEEIGTVLTGLGKKKGIIINEEKVASVKKMTKASLSKVTVSEL